MSTELTVIPPHELMRQATDCAGVCKDIAQRLAVTIQGRNYLPIEAWQSIATAHNCVTWGGEPKSVEINGVQGFEADGFARLPDGSILIAKGAGFVGDDETDSKGNPTWGSRPIYAQRAMAQTRAASRISRALFAHVVALMNCGLSTTPAEEVPHGGFSDDKPPQGEPQSQQEQREQKTLEGVTVANLTQSRDKTCWFVDFSDGSKAWTRDSGLADDLKAAKSASCAVKVTLRAGQKANSWELIDI